MINGFKAKGQESVPYTTLDNKKEIKELGDLDSINDKDSSKNPHRTST